MIHSDNHISILTCIAKFILCFFILLTQITLFAQIEKNDFEKVIIEIEGEKVFNVGVITQDLQGYIWLGTNLGLIRYDGIEGKIYDITRDESITNDYIETLFVDHSGDLWISANSGLSKYNPDCDCIVHFPVNIEDNNLSDILAITADHNNNVWIGTQHGRLFRYERENDQFISWLPQASDSTGVVYKGIYHLLVDKINNLWIGTDSGLVQFNIDSGMTKQFSRNPLDLNSLKDNRISALYEDQQGKILVGTFKSGFYIYDPITESLNEMILDHDHPNQLHAPLSEKSVFGDDPRVNIIHQDQNGGYWIGTTGAGVNYFNLEDNTYINYDFNLVNPQVLWSLYEDRQGNLWFGGIMGSGLFRADLFARKFNVNTNFANVEAVYESPLNPGILWVSSQEYGLRKLNLKTEETISYVPDGDNYNSIGHSWVRSVYQEDLKTLWVGLGNGGPYGGQDGNGGIGRMDIAGETFTNFKLTRNDDDLDGFSYTVYTICEDREGHLWAGTGPGGIFRSDKDKNVFKHYKILEDEHSSGKVFLNIIRIDSNGDIWASDFAGEGTLYLYDQQEDKFNPYLKGFKMYNLVIDEKGWFLISTWEKGLVHFNPVDRTYIQYTKKDGLPTNNIVSVSIDYGENGIYWLNTRFGPAKFNAKNGEISAVGLPNYRYNRDILKASDNQLYMGSVVGLVSFSPAQVKGNPYPPQLMISDLAISDTNLLLDKKHSDEFNLTHDQNDITFKYIGLHFSNPENNSYQYKLGPLDDEWVNAGNERSVRFANLSPGDYEFQVMASNSDGVWNTDLASIHFTINPPWWKTWWAYLIYAAIAIAFADRFYRFQLTRRMAVAESNRLKEVNQLKNSLFTNITHEFRTPLTVIKGMTGAIKSDLEHKQFESLDKSLEIIDRNSEGLLNLINEMLDLAKIESGNMELNLVQADVIPYIKYLTQSFHSLAEGKGIGFYMHCELEQLKMDLDVNKFTAIVTNLLSNAIKFTPENGKVSVHVDRIMKNNSDHFLLKVNDTGVGITREEQLHIFDKFYQVDSSTSRLEKGTGIGLALVKEFVGLMKGSIDVESVQGKGSVFNLFIPLTTDAVPVDGSELVAASSVIKSNVIPALSEDKHPSTVAHNDLPLVLIVEDNLDVAHYIKTCLEENYQFLHAQNGTIGIDMALDKIPDIIISDVMMPEKDGFEVCEYLKTDELTDHIPIIMLTAKATFEDRLTGLSHGADAYLTKPFEKAELLTRIEQLILLRKKMLSKFEKTGIDRLLSKNVKSTETKFLKKIITIIHDNMTADDFGPVQLAYKLHISESQLYRKLKAISGKSTAVFIRSIRLQKGKELIQTTTKTISEVAYDVGFNDPSYFSRAFKEEFGHPPSNLS